MAMVTPWTLSATLARLVFGNRHGHPLPMAIRWSTRRTSPVRQAGHLGLAWLPILVGAIFAGTRRLAEPGRNRSHRSGDCGDLDVAVTGSSFHSLRGSRRIESQTRYGAVLVSVIGVAILAYGLNRQGEQDIAESTEPAQASSTSVEPGCTS